MTERKADRETDRETQTLLPGQVKQATCQCRAEMEWQVQILHPAIREKGGMSVFTTCPPVLPLVCPCLSPLSPKTTMLMTLSYSSFPSPRPVHHHPNALETTQDNEHDSSSSFWFFLYNIRRIKLFLTRQTSRCSSRCLSPPTWTTITPSSLSASHLCS